MSPKHSTKASHPAPVPDPVPPVTVVGPLLRPPFEAPLAEGEAPVEDAAKARALELVEYAAITRDNEVICQKLGNLDLRAVAWALLEYERLQANRKIQREAARKPGDPPPKRTPILAVPMDAVPRPAWRLAESWRAARGA